MGYNIPNKIRILYSFFWVIPRRLNFMCRRFGTLYSIFIGDEDGGVLTLPMKMEQRVPKRRHIKFRRRGNTQKKEYNIQSTAKVWNKKDSYCFVHSYWEPEVHAVEGRCILNAGKADVPRWNCKLYMVFCLTESVRTFYCFLIDKPVILGFFFFWRWSQLYEKCNSRAKF